jgi:CspA family cold shock protein
MARADLPRRTLALRLSRYHVVTPLVDSAQGHVIPRLDSPPREQHNAYTFFAGLWNRAFSEEAAKKKGEHVERLKGTVKWFNNAKGYGFLGRDDGPDVFIHYSSITTEGYKSLQEGDTVEFEIVQGQKGPQAANVSKVP